MITKLSDRYNSALPTFRIQQSRHSICSIETMLYLLRDPLQSRVPFPFGNREGYFPDQTAERRHMLQGAACSLSNSASPCQKKQPKAPRSLFELYICVILMLIIIIIAMMINNKYIIIIRIIIFLLLLLYHYYY